MKDKGTKALIVVLAIVIIIAGGVFVYKIVKDKNTETSDVSESQKEDLLDRKSTSPRPLYERCVVYRKQNITHSMPIIIISHPPYHISGRPTAHASRVVMAIAFTMAPGETHPIEHARSGPSRVSSSLPLRKSK